MDLMAALPGVRPGSACGSIKSAECPRVVMTRGGLWIAMRYLCSELMNVCVLAGNRAVREVIGILDEISASGACLQLEENPGMNTRLRFASLDAIGSSVMEGTVTSCEHVPGVGYYVEVRFTHNFYWRPAIYKPKHLLDCGQDLRRRRECVA